MKYVVDDKKLNAATFIAFVNQVWQGSYDVEKTQGALSKTINITAYDNEVLIGCLRILTDGYYFGTITELLVLPEYQKQGVGSKLLQLAKDNTPTMLYFGAQPGIEKFYEKNGCKILTGKELANWTPPPKKEEKTEPKVLRLPEKYQDSKRVIQYLFNRGIDYHIIQECIADGVIFESNGRYHNAVFVGKDETGTPKYAAYRGLGSSTFKGDAYGSDKQYSFRLLAKEPCQSVHLFEAAIDLLSYATLLKAQGKDYKAENLLSLSGVYQPKKENKDSKIPIALSVFLEKNPLIKTIHLHLDNDKTGRLCANTLKELLRNKYEVFDEPPKKGKDYNDYLCIQLGIYKSKERSYER